MGSLTAESVRGIVALPPRLRAFARSLAGTRDGADDLVPATCERGLRAAESFAPGTRLDAWLFRIMRSRWIDEHRAARPQLSLGDPELAPALELEGPARRGYRAAAAARRGARRDGPPAGGAAPGPGARQRAGAELPRGDGDAGGAVGTVRNRLARTRSAVGAALGAERPRGEEIGHG